VGLEAREPLEAVESFIFLCHAPDVTLSEEQLAGLRLGSSVEESPSIGSLRPIFLCPGLG
jgi:hypothetical protein